MPQAPLPRDPNFFKLLNDLFGRVRRLEVNKTLPLAGVATYHKAFSLSAGTTWTPDFSAATSSLDQIGLTLDSSGVFIPTGWLAIVVIELKLSCTNPPMGDSLVWDITVNGALDGHYSPSLLNGSQYVSGMVLAYCGWNAPGPMAVDVGAVTTAYGSSFTPSEMAVFAGAIQLPVEAVTGGVD